MVLQDRDAAVEPERTQSLHDHHGAGGGVLLQQFRDGRLERIQLAGALSPRRGWAPAGQILGHRAPAEVKMAGDLAQATSGRPSASDE